MIVLSWVCGFSSATIAVNGKFVDFSYIVQDRDEINLFNSVTPFCRCLRCNGLLQPVEKSSIIDQLPDSVKLQVDEFHRCGECEQIYWRGSHYERMQQFINDLLAAKIEA